MEKQLSWSKEVDFKDLNLPRSWNIKTPVCGLLLRYIDKCKSYVAKECPYKCLLTK